MNTHGLQEAQIQAINRFPDQNPNPVMRMAADGHLTYANSASEPLQQALGLAVGKLVPADAARQLRALAEGDLERMEVEHDHRTFALLAVDVPDFGFLNIYGTDVTAEKVVARFPDQNPNPVLRLNLDGELLYANAASQPIVEAMGLVVGSALPRDLLETVRSRLAAQSREPIEIVSGELTFEIVAVLIREFGFINLYGTDVTAARALAEAKDQTERLLLNILPPPIADRLRAGERVIADRFPDATLLIADIVGFTQMSSGLTPNELVGMLDEVFTTCDELVERHGLEKVKTIGDAYMVVGGVPVKSSDHVARVADFALDMARAVGELQDGSAHPVSFRVGINTGPVVAGVIGRQRTIYDVWGDTVNLASRMESLSLPGRIQVSPLVHERLGDRFKFEPRGEIEVKGKGVIPTWFLVGRR